MNYTVQFTTYNYYGIDVHQKLDWVLGSYSLYNNWPCAFHLFLLGESNFSIQKKNKEYCPMEEGTYCKQKEKKREINSSLKKTEKNK